MKIDFLPDYYILVIKSTNHWPSSAALKEFFQSIQITATNVPKKGSMISLSGIKYNQKFLLIEGLFFAKMNPEMVTSTKINFEFDQNGVSITITVGNVVKTSRVSRDILSLAYNASEPTPYQAPVQIPEWKFRMWRMQLKIRRFWRIIKNIFGFRC
ncbi:hypothetical protein H6775_00865 [Candidatus Nomurabacteria bacterium]|nr:hypothetical protein [Candidatus Nomurabacteria bacterium]